MNAPPRTPLQLDIFSARSFFEGIARAERHSTGRVSSTLTQYEPGMHYVPRPPLGCSLLWVDGAYGHSLRVQELIHELLAGGMPRPVVSAQRTSIRSIFRHCSPAALSRQGKSILAAIGHIDDLRSLAAKASVVLCPSCGSATQRFAQPVRLVEEIARVWNGSKISLLARSSSSDFLRWTERHGFSARAITGNAHEVRLHRSPATLGDLGPITSLLRSLWNIPDICIVCSDDSKTFHYTKHGWCSHCHAPLSPISVPQIYSLLERGLSPDAPLPDAARIALNDTMTLGHILQTPIAQLPELPSPKLRTTADLLTEAGLGRLSLGMSTADIAATDCAALSVCVSMSVGSDAHHSIIIDLPPHTLGARRFQGCKQALEREALSRPVILTNASVFEPRIPQAPTERHGQGPCLGTLTISAASPHHYEIVLGETVQVHARDTGSRAVFHSIAAALNASTPDASRQVQFEPRTSYQLHAIPLFSAAGGSKTLLLDALGLQDSLANLYAASLDARSIGLRPRDFSLGATKSNPHICKTCTGLGVVLERLEELPRPLTTPCPICHGLRCKSPVRDSMFRGTPFSRMLNQTCAEAHSTLRALPKAARTLALVERFGLHDIPLGMPLTLLSDSEQRAVLLVRAIVHSTHTKPSIILLEEPLIGLSDLQRAALDDVCTTSPEPAALTRIEVSE